MLKAIAQGVLRDSAADDWKFIASKRDVSLSSRTTNDTNVQQVRAVGIVNGSLDGILKHITNPFCSRGKKDAVIECREIVMNERTGEKKLYRAQKMPWPLLARDFVLESNVIKMEDGTAIWAARSTTDPGFPAVENRVRADCKNSSWVIRPIHKFKCHVTYMAQIDLKGNIPVKIKNKFMTQEAMWVADICRFFQRQMNSSLDRTAALSIEEGKEESKDSSSVRAKSLKKGSGSEIKPLSKKSREYIKEIVRGRDKGGGSEDGFESWGSFSGKEVSPRKQGSAEYQWKKLQNNSREYFRDLLNPQHKSPSSSPSKKSSDYSDHTPPSSPRTGGRDVDGRATIPRESGRDVGRRKEGRVREIDPLTPTHGEKRTAHFEEKDEEK